MADEVIYMCLPSYNGLDPRAAQQFWERAIMLGGRYAHLGKIQNPKGGSSLTDTFNGHWCNALNLKRQGVNITRFAMQHADVVPQDWFLDSLLSDLDLHGADVVSAVIAIKDSMALSSTGIDDPNDEWDVLRRLSLDEVSRLPPVFTAADCGYPDNALLVNTGCWVADFTKDWIRKVHFEVQNGIVFDPDGYARTKFRPEDWNFSRMLHKLGAKVMASRNVAVSHVGSVDYPNTPGWGRSRWDEAHASKFLCPLGTDEPAVRGWLTPQEGALLQELARGKRVLEIGSYCGKSSIYLARTAAHLHCLDTFESDAVGASQPENTYMEFMNNITRHGLADKVTATIGNSKDRPAFGGKFDMIFIDGAHDYESVKNDIEYALEVITDDGILVFHDYHSAKDPDVTRVVDWLLGGWIAYVRAKITNRTGSVVAIEITKFDDSCYGKDGVTGVAGPCGGPVGYEVKTDETDGISGSTWPRGGPAGHPGPPGIDR